MSVQALGYIGLRAKDLGDWAKFGSDFLGMQRIDKTRASMAFRMDDRKQRVIIDADGGQGIGYFGWEVADAAAMEALAAKLEAAGVKVARGSRALADERHVKDLIVFQDPAGTRIEAFHGPEVASTPFAPGRNISGFRTGPLGMGHVVLHCEDIEQMTAFYEGLLGFRLSDYFLRPYPARFFHCNPRHHSLALTATGKNAPHHMMVELYSLDDVGQGYDIAQGNEGQVAVTMGRHSGDYMTSFYSWNPLRLHDRVRLGRAGGGRRDLEAVRAALWAEHLGPRPRVAFGRKAHRGTRDAHEGRRRRPAPARAGDRGQPQSDARRVSLVGRHEAAEGGVARSHAWIASTLPRTVAATASVR